MLPPAYPLPTRWLRAAGLLAALLPLSLNTAAVRAGETGETAGPTPTYSLEDCVRVARENSPEVRAAAKTVEGTRAGVTTAKSGFLPQVGASGTYLKREGDSVRSIPGNETRRTDDYTFSARVTQNVFSSGRVRAQVDIAKRSLAVQELSLRTTLETVTLAVRTAFFQVLQAERNVSVRQQAVSLLRQQENDEQSRFKAGQSSQVNVGRVQVNLANELPALLSAQADIVSSYVALAEAMGVPYRPGSARPPFSVRGSLEDSPAAPSLDACLVRAENQRPELAARRLDVQNANRQITVDASGTRPRVDVFAGYDVFSEPSVLSQRDFYNGYIVGVQASWQVFDGLATLGRVRADRARVVAASEALRGVRLQVQGEVRTAYEALRLAEETLRSQEGGIALAQENLKLVGTNLGVGLGSQLELLQSRLDLTRTQTTRISALYARRNARARLDRAMGETAPADQPVAAKTSK